MVKPKIAIYDFTDCEGCEVVIISLREGILALENRIDIVDWRLGQEKKEPFVHTQGKPLTASIIEGTPITQVEVDTLKYLRKNSTFIIALGACASIAGIPGIIKKEDRKKLYKKIYGSKYKPKGIDAQPLSAYVKVDYAINGCPVDKDELVKVFEELLSGRLPSYRSYSVCFDCKVAKNKCRIVSGKPCLGPITQGGCGAVCISGGSPCYGCFGMREGANMSALVKTLGKICDRKEIKRYLSMFNEKTPEYKEYIDEL